MSGIAHPETDEGEDTLVLEYDLAAPPEKVWRALAVPELLDEWLAEDGARPAERRYEIVDTEPPARMRLAWREEGETRFSSQVLLEVEPRPDGQTRFRITHSATSPVTMTAANGNAPPRALAA